MCIPIGLRLSSGSCHRKRFLIRIPAHCTLVRPDNPRSPYLFNSCTWSAVGILGATVMPHALFLGSFMATQDRTGESVLPAPVLSQETSTLDLKDRFRQWFASLFEVSRAERIALSRDYRMKYERENNSLSFIKAHLKHGIVIYPASSKEAESAVNITMSPLRPTGSYEHLDGR